MSPSIRVLLAAFLATAGSLPCAQPMDSGARIVGEWRGTSVCTNLKLAPACKDETVRYVFTRAPGSTETYHLVADKLVGSQFETMYEMDFGYSPSASTWSRDLDAPTCQRCRWWYRIEGSELMGGVASGTGEAIRKVSARRHP